MSITLAAMALYALAKRRRKKMSMDADALLTRIENIVTKPEAASAPVSVSPINWGAARRQLSRAQGYIRKHAGATNGVHEGVLLGTALSAKAKRKSRKAQLAAAGRKGARVRAEKQAVRERAAKKAAKTRAENEAKRLAAARKAARTRAAKKERYAKAAAKAKRTRAKHTSRRKHGKK